MRSTAARDYQTVPRPVAVMAKDFARGASTGWHSHERTQLLFAVSGLMTVATADGTWAVPAGHALLIPPGLSHDVSMHGDVAMRTAYLAPEALARRLVTCRVVLVSDLLESCLTSLAEEPILYDEAARGGWLAALALDEVERAPEAPFALPMPIDRRLRRLCDALIADPGRALDIDGWADEIGVSRRTLTRRMREETGLSFGGWRRRVRLIAAMTRRAQARSVGESVADLGYRDLRPLRSMVRRRGGAP